MSVHRRHLLVIGGTSIVGVTGCLGNASEPETADNNDPDGSDLDDDNDGDVPTGDDESADSSNPSVDETTMFEVGIKSADVSGELDFSAEVIDHVSDDHPATIGTRVSNTTEDAVQLRWFGESAIPFHGRWLEELHGDNSLWVLHEDDPTRTDGCWVARGGTDDVAVALTLEPDEVAEDTISVFGDSIPVGDGERIDKCYTAGEFSEEFTLGLFDVESDERLGEAEFSLTLELSAVE